MLQHIFSGDWHAGPMQADTRSSCSISHFGPILLKNSSLIAFQRELVEERRLRLLPRSHHPKSSRSLGQLNQ